MADTSIYNLTASGAIADGDLIPVVDISDTTQSANGSTRKITKANFVVDLAPKNAPTFTTSMTGSFLTASELLATDASKNIVSLAAATYPSLTELSYVKGLTSAVQTQLGLKAPLASPSFTGTPTMTESTDASAVQVAILQGDRATPTDADTAYVTLRLSNDAGTQKEFGRISWGAIDVNAGTGEDGILFWGIMDAGSFTNKMRLEGSAFSPHADNGIALGTTALKWADAFFASGAVINFDNGDVTLTHSANLLTLAGGDMTIGGALTVTGVATLATSLTGVLRADTGVVSVDTDVTDIVSAASLTAAGKVELATTAEIDTGTDTGRAIPIDQFVASNRNVRYVIIRLLAAATATTVSTTVGGDVEFPFTGTIIEVGAYVDTAGTTNLTTVDINKAGTTILSTKITIDSTEKSSRTAATAPVISVSSITAGDILTFDIDAIQTTAALGLSVRIGVRMT